MMQISSRIPVLGCLHPGLLSQTSGQRAICVLLICSRDSTVMRTLQPCLRDAVRVLMGSSMAHSWQPGSCRGGR